MGFINKLIKKGIIGLALCFSFFLFCGGEKVYADAKCTSKINDGNDYLVLNTGAGWSDSGVEFICDEVRNPNVSVSINGEFISSTDNSGSYVTDRYLLNVGFYKINYYLTDTINYPDDVITRNVRVLPENLNSVRNIWLGDFNENTASNDVFVKIIDHGSNYIALGNFGNDAYVVYFNSLGSYEWHETFAGVTLNDIVKSNSVSGNIYIIAGKNASGYGFVKGINVSSSGLDDVYDNVADFGSNVTSINKLVVSSSYVYAVGYLQNVDGSKTGKIARLLYETLGTTPVYYTNAIASEYNSVVATQVGGEHRVVAVGSTSIENNSGATGGLVTVCDEALSSCSDESPYIWQNSNGASTTTTIFNDIIRQGNNFIIVGKSRVDRITGSVVTKNYGVEDSIVVILNDTFTIIDARLVGGVSYDEIYSIKEVSKNINVITKINTYNYVLAGKKGNTGVYYLMNIVENSETSELSLSLEENIVSGKNGNVDLKDVFVRIGADEESTFVFIGSTDTAVVENMILSQKIVGNKDSLILVLDNTMFENYLQINMLQNSTICKDGTTSCLAGNLIEDYWLVYGTKKISVSSINTISSVTTGTYYVFHSFKNGQGINFVLGRTIVVSTNPVAPDANFDYMGIDNWFLYDRKSKTKIGSNVGQRERYPMWTTRYMPVGNGVAKEKNVKYYVISSGKFVEDTSSSTKTYDNYIKLEEEPLSLSTAFQSETRAREYALLQEFARIAFVETKYSYESTGITFFSGEGDALSNQNYYFVYYIDLNINGANGCGVSGVNNNILYGTCTEYTGYAFASLKNIQKIAKLILDKYDYFVSENTTRFNPKGSVAVPVSEYYKEELYTEKYMKSNSVGLSSNLYLEVTAPNSYYTKSETFIDPDDSNKEITVVKEYKDVFVNNIVGSNLKIVKYTYLKNEDVYEFVSKSDYKTVPLTRNEVVFDVDGVYSEEGKYSVRYCYNYGDINSEDCGKVGEFSIDRTAPVINYDLFNGTSGKIDKPSSESNPHKIKTSMKVENIFDIDPYAYTVVNGRKYYLQCNEKFASSSCVSNLAEYVHKAYTYDSENPNKVYSITVYDRVGNSLVTHFKVGTLMPKLSVGDNVDTNSFVLTVDFFGKNSIDSFGIVYTKSEICSSDSYDYCAKTNSNLTVEEEMNGVLTIDNAIMTYIRALIYRNNVELAKAKEDSEYTPIVVNSVDFNFVFSVFGDDSTGGLRIPKVIVEEVEGEVVYTISEDEYNVLTISKGLYYFTMVDSFFNSSSAYGGIGLDKAELYLYVNDNDDAVENENNLSNVVPVTKEENEVGVNLGEGQTALIVKEPSTYAFVEQLPNELLNDFNEEMFFTNKFIYVKFKKSNYGILRISIANTLNVVGSYGRASKDNSNLTCLFTIYGSEIDESYLNDCVNYKEDGFTKEEDDMILLNNIKTYESYLAKYGVYFMDEYNGYCYLAFTKEGTYDIWSEIYVKVKDSGVNAATALPVSRSFTIDTTKPLVDLIVECEEGKTCIGEEDNFVDSNFVLDGNNHVYNIGTFNMKFMINLDLLVGNAVNRLLVVTVNSSEDYQNAYSYSLNGSNPYYGNYITFSESGTYVITFYDSAKNSVSYTFIIDKNAPVISDIEDINGKSFNTYQQFLDLEISISEDTFLVNNTNEKMMTIYYKIDDATEQEITIMNVDGSKCRISSGIDEDDGECIVVDNGDIKGIYVIIRISINKDEATRDPTDSDKTLILRTVDYFGNEAARSEKFVFDNASPYIHFAEEYTPVYEFGASTNNTVRESWLTMSGKSSVETLCENPIKFTVGPNRVEKEVVVCGDTPYTSGLTNGVSVQTYEAYRVSFNNYKKKIDNNYEKMSNGTYLSVTDTVYRKKYYMFDTKERLEAAKIDTSVTVYTKGNYVQVGANEYIDPNVTYYDSTGSNPVSIQDMYINTSKYSSCNTSRRDCVLYNMYMSNGKFETDQNFYVYDTDDYKEVEDKTSINVNDYLSYYYTIDGAYVTDQGKYLPALTIENSCVIVNGGTSCLEVPAGRVKVKDYKVSQDVTNTFAYYNVILPTAEDQTNPKVVKSVSIGGSAKFAILDTRIWQIAIDAMGNKVSFGFTLQSINGRPIIFASKDGAGNEGSNYIETVIAITDSQAPSVTQVSSVRYVVDNDGKTKNNYILKDVYYKLNSVKDLDCSKSTTEYFTYNEGTGVYSSVTCSTEGENKMDDLHQYYIKVKEYVLVDDDLDKDTENNGDYYKVEEKKDLGTNYLTSDDLIVKFDEPIYKIECSYYVYDTILGEGIEKNCDFHNSEYDYSDARQVFELIYKPLPTQTNYFVNYTLKAYDFAMNSQSFNYFFVDRERPVIEFDSPNGNVDKDVETNYTDSNIKSKYDEKYLDPSNGNGFSKDTNPTDLINNRIINVSATNINNSFKYIVKYYSFRYDITYKNYIKKDDGTFESTPDGNSKSEATKNLIDKNVYVLIKVPSDYILKDNTGVCKDINGSQYCYVIDDSNYYDSLLENSVYWSELNEEEYYIKNNKVGVYKVTYTVIDYSGNISDTITRTVYCHDRTRPTMQVNGLNSTNLYGYHKDVVLRFENEKEAMYYRYSCVDGDKTCSLPNQIFAPVGMDLETEFESVTGNVGYNFDDESIYKIYFHDKGSYVESVNSDGEIVMVLKYNAIEYTFLIDRTSPVLYLNMEFVKDSAGNIIVDDNGNNKVYYIAHLDTEEYLYCVKANRNSDSISFSGQSIECKNSPAFSGEWINPNDYVNMSVVYEYVDGTDVYKFVAGSGRRVLYKNSNRYEMSYVSDTEYKYSDGTNEYTVILDDKYKLKIGQKEYVDFVETYSYSSDSQDYKFVAETSKLYIDGVEYTLTLNNGIYEYKDDVKLMTYSLRFRNGTYQIKIVDETVVIRRMYNSEGEVIYEEKYTKLLPGAKKYFYNTYYYKNGDNLIKYDIGVSYDENNVYLLKSIDAYFRDDGKYLVKTSDAAGNVTGRQTSSTTNDAEQSEFIIDNSAPTYNKSLTTPTGINYWYSVPREVITSQNMNVVSGIGAASASGHDIMNSATLNSDFFYAFATKAEAESYLISIYKDHINLFYDNTCTFNGVRGFNYTYYNPSSMRMESNCFVGTNGVSNIVHASNEISKIIKEMVYPTFSGPTLFGDSSIKQVACDSSVSSKCLNNVDMYKVVYLKIDLANSNNKTVVETCNESATVQCIKVNAKIMNYKKDATKTVDIGTRNAIDTSLVKVYSVSLSDLSNTSKSELSLKEEPNSLCPVDGDGNLIHCVGLNRNSYYIFEEYDTTIKYVNYNNKGSGVKEELEHINVTYYAIYVDTNVETEKYIDVYYDEGNGIVYNSLTTSGRGSVMTNVDEYYLIIKNNGDADFINKYEIHMTTSVINGVVVINEVYSYLILKIGNSYHNINNYLVPICDTLDQKCVSGSKVIDYYFRIPMQRETYNQIELMDRAGNKTVVEISMSQRAPSISTSYSGSGGTQTVTLEIRDTDLTATKKDSIEILFSTDRVNFTDIYTANIRAALVCKAGSTGYLYGCNNVSASNGANSYRVVISNLEGLYGFFQVKLMDNHDNTNFYEFMYNPADMSASYDAINRYIDNNMEDDNYRMITNKHVQIEFNNQINYLVLYKLVDGEYVSVCNTKNIKDGVCPGENLENKVVQEIEGTKYVKTTIYYVDEGIYMAKIFNRASEVINRVCFKDDGSGVKDDCKTIHTSSLQNCSWSVNPDLCDNALEVVERDVTKVYGNLTYNKVEIDKTMPIIDISTFVVSSPDGVSNTFVNNGSYTNTEITINWQERYLQLSYSCEYLDYEEHCNGNSTGFSSGLNSYTFTLRDTRNTKYQFWFEDYAGNSTINSKYSFTINIVLPEIEVYELDENGNIDHVIYTVDSEGTSKTNKNLQLLCYVAGENDPGCGSYYVKLERWTGSGYQQVFLSDITRISEEYGRETKYRYTVHIKNKITGEPYSTLKVDETFIVDKKAPNIVIEGSYYGDLKIYKGNVTVKTDGFGTVFAGCVVTGVDSNGNNTYNCMSEPYVMFESNTSLSETGTYMIVAVDDIGNVTIDNEIKYVTIDNESPDISIKSKGAYIDYDIPENGFTNAKEVLIKTSDNSVGSKFKYRVKNENDEYGDWIIHESDELTIFEEGFYEVVPIDYVGNEGIERHFIIYRKAPKFSVIVNGDLYTGGGIIEDAFYIRWNDIYKSYEAPIVKVTVNGKTYSNSKFVNGQHINKEEVLIKDSGEYLFVFTDLAGNTSTYKIAINNSDIICLNNKGIEPRAKLFLIATSGDGNGAFVYADGYEFKKDDVIIFATAANYFGGSSACGVDALNYRTIYKDYYVIMEKYVDYANKSQGLPMTLSDELKITIGELGGYIYAFVIDRDTAKDAFGIVVKDRFSFFAKDPLGWSLVFIAGFSVLCLGIKLVFFRKKVRVLK